MPLSPIPSILVQLAFWGAYLLGSLSLVFSWLLAQVPRPLNGADLRLDYVVRSTAVLFLLMCILCANRLRNVQDSTSEGGLGIAMQIALGAALLEFVFSLYWVIILATYR
jgi:hypothetical protein